MKNNKINSMNREEMVLRYMNSRTGDFDWSMPSAIVPAKTDTKLGHIQKEILEEAGVLR